MALSCSDIPGLAGRNSVRLKDWMRFGLPTSRHCIKKFTCSSSQFESLSYLNRLPPFKLERFFSKYEFSAKHLLCCSDPEPLKMATLLEMADADCQDRWLTLSLGYTDTLGLPALRNEIASLYSGSLGLENLVVLAPEEGIFLAMLAMLSTGDHVVCTAPGYQSLSEVAACLGCEVTPWDVSVNEEGHFRFDVEQLEQLIRPTTRCVIVNFPHNPTGALPSGSEWESIVQCCSKVGAWLFSDEMYRETEDNPSLRLTAACEKYERAISLSGLSKAYGLPGLRLGWLASQNKDVLRRVAELKDYTTICSAAPAEWAPPIAGTVAFPSLKSSEPIETFCQRCVEEASVLLLPATVYNHLKSTNENRFRLGFGRATLTRSLKVLSEYLDRKPPR
eukprot:jgi/Botrbrau1/16942/Bobra.49_2s0008.2